VARVGSANIGHSRLGGVLFSCGAGFSGRRLAHRAAARGGFGFWGMSWLAFVPSSKCLSGWVLRLDSRSGLCVGWVFSFLEAAGLCVKLSVKRLA